MAKPAVLTVAPEKGQIDSFPGRRPRLIVAAFADEQEQKSGRESRPAVAEPAGRPHASWLVAGAARIALRPQAHLHRRSGTREINPGIDNLDRIAEGLRHRLLRAVLLSPDQAQPMLYQSMKGGR